MTLNAVRSMLFNLWERLRSSYWFVPSVMAIGAIVLAMATLALDGQLTRSSLRKMQWVYAGGAEGARTVLSAVAGSVITVAGVVFSITVAALTLASSQFGPRLLRNFMRDLGNQVVLGTFIATHLYCLLVLRTVRGSDGGGGEFVPHVSITTGLLLALTSLAVLIYFIHHVARSMQAPDVIAGVARELHSSIDHLFPQSLGEESGGLTGHGVQGLRDDLDAATARSCEPAARVICSLSTIPPSWRWPNRRT